MNPKAAPARLSWAQQGVSHFNAGRFQEALRCFDAAFAAGGRDPQLREFRAHTLDALNLPGKSLRAFADLISEQPRRLSAYYGLAAVVLRRGGSREARAALSRALTLKPSVSNPRERLADALTICASALRAAGDFQAAGRVMRRAHDLAGTDESRERLIELLRAHADAHLAAAHPGQAATLLKEALFQRPQDEALRGAASHAFLAAGRPDQAWNLLRATKGQEPADAAARRGRARLLCLCAGRQLAAGSTGKAEAALRLAQSLAPRDAESKRMLARLPRRAGAFDISDELALTRHSDRLLSRGRNEEAQKLLKTALSRRLTRPRKLALLRVLGQVYKSSGRLEQAASIFRSLVKLDPGDALAPMWLGDLLVAAGKPAEGKDLLRRALRLDEGSLPPIERFRILVKLGRWRAAVVKAEEILDGKPTRGDIAGFNEPWSLRRPQTDSERRAALRLLERDLAASSPWLHFYRGELDPARRWEHYARLSRFPEKRYGWMIARAGRSALACGDFAQAERWLRKGARWGPVDWRNHAILAETCLCLQRPAAALREADRALRAAAAEESGVALAWRGKLELWLGDYARALRTLEKACALDAPFSHCRRAACLLLLGKAAEAVKLLDKTLLRSPRDPEALLWRGEAKRALGRCAEALEDLENPVFAEAGPQKWLWARVNRALARGALNDRDGMKSDLDSIPSFVISFIRKKTGRRLRPEPEIEDMELVLKDALRLARGFRRDEYSQALWLEPATLPGQQTPGADSPGPELS